MLDLLVCKFDAMLDLLACLYIDCLLCYEPFVITHVFQLLLIIIMLQGFNYATF
jgi:hypothetical protein